MNAMAVKYIGLAWVVYGIHAYLAIAQVALGREIKMIELKEEINELLGKLGQGEKYEIVE